MSEIENITFVLLKYIIDTIQILKYSEVYFLSLVEAISWDL